MRRLRCGTERDETDPTELIHFVRQQFDVLDHTKSAEYVGNFALAIKLEKENESSTRHKAPKQHLESRLAAGFATACVPAAAHRRKLLEAAP